MEQSNTQRQPIAWPLTKESALQYYNELLTAQFRFPNNEVFTIDMNLPVGIGAKLGYEIAGPTPDYVDHESLVKMLNGETVNGMVLIKP